MSATTEPPLIDVPERLDGDRTVLLMPGAGTGAEMALVITQSLSHLRPWMPWAQEAPTAESSELVVRRMQADFIARRDLCFHIRARRPDGGAGRLLGGTGLHRIDWAVRRFEIGYWLRPDAVGQGHVSETVRLLTALAFDRLAARRVEIRCDARNARSRAVAERCGFELEGILRNNVLGVDDHPRDSCIYARISAPTA